MIITTRNAYEFGITYALELVARGATPSLGNADNDNPFLERKLKTWSQGYNEWNVIASIGTTAEAVSGGADVSGFPLVARGGDYEGGSVVVRLNNGRTTRKITLDLSDTGAATSSLVATAVTPNTKYTEWLSFISPLINASGKDLQIYRDKTTYLPKDIGTGTSRNNIERNPNWWGGSGWDLSGVPIWNSGSNSPKYGMALITGSHLLAAKHYKPPVGATVEFLGNNGTVYTRQIIGENSRTSADTAILDDLHVFTLSDAPTGFSENVTPFNVIGEWVGDFGVDGFYSAFVGFYVNQSRKGYFSIGVFPGAYTSTRSGSYNGVSFEFDVTTVGVAGIFTVNDEPYLENEYRGNGGVPGDSGGPYFHVSAAGLALVGLFDVPQGGPFPHSSLLNEMILTSDSDAIARGNLTSPTGLTVTVAPDPTL